jgi:RND family efflux transporter MFP subunit
LKLTLVKPHLFRGAARSDGRRRLLLIAPALAALASTATAEPIPVTAAPLETLYIFPSTDAPAAVVSLNDAKVSAETPGVITEFAVQVGDAAKKGDVLASINCEEHTINAESAAAELEAARSRLAFSNTQLNNARQLSSKKGISQEQLEERRSVYAVATAEVEKARATLEAARRLVSHCKVRAPFDGTVIERIASVGDYAPVGTPLVRIIDTSNIEVTANVQEQDLPSLTETKELYFFDRQTEYPVKLRTVLPVMESRLRSFEVRLTFSGQPAASGTAGRLRWKSPWPHVSSEYLVQRNDELGLFVLSEGVAQFHSLNNAQQGRPARVSLPRGTTVILNGRHSLQNGDPVSVTPSSSS